MFLSKKIIHLFIVLLTNFHSGLNEFEESIRICDLAASVFRFFGFTFPLEQKGEGQDWSDNAEETGLERLKSRLEMFVVANTHCLEPVKRWIKLKTIWIVEII